MTDFKALRHLAVDLAGQASDLLLERFAARGANVDTKTTATDMVTDIDRDSEALIVDGLRRDRPDDGILGEEGASVEGTTGIRWVIDPLDGTTNYLYGLPAYAVSIAAELDGEAVAGAVADPAHGEIFSAARGSGATCNGHTIAVSGASDLGTALVATGFGYRAEQRARQARIVAEVLPEVRDIRRYGAAALDMCWVACGRLDAYYESGIKHWDVAAGGLIAIEAGAHVVGLEGFREGATSAQVVATSPALAQPLLKLLDAASSR